MTFKPGNQYGKGRPKGSVHNKTKHFQEVLEARGFDVAEAFMDIHQEAIRFYEMNKTDPIGGPPALRIVLDVTKEIASYTLPRLKAIEMPKENLVEGLSKEEKLRLMKDAVAQLEAEMDNEPLKIERKE